MVAVGFGEMSTTGANNGQDVDNEEFCYICFEGTTCGASGELEPLVQVSWQVRFGREVFTSNDTIYAHFKAPCPPDVFPQVSPTSFFESSVSLKCFVGLQVPNESSSKMCSTLAAVFCGETVRDKGLGGVSQRAQALCSIVLITCGQRDGFGGTSSSDFRCSQRHGRRP